MQSGSAIAQVLGPAQLLQGELEVIQRLLALSLHLEDLGHGSQRQADAARVAETPAQLESLPLLAQRLVQLAEVEVDFGEPVGVDRRQRGLIQPGEDRRRFLQPFGRPGRLPEPVERRAHLSEGLGLPELVPSLAGQGQGLPESRYRHPVIPAPGEL